MVDDHEREHGSITEKLETQGRRIDKIERLVSQLLVVSIGAVLTTIGTIIAALLIGSVNVLGA